jgi:hypothetical protein
MAEGGRIDNDDRGEPFSGIPIKVNTATWFPALGGALAVMESAFVQALRKH